MRFGVISDPHLAPVDAEPYVWHNRLELPRSGALLDAGLAWLAGHEVDALVLLGDLTEGADGASFAAVRDRALAFGKPVLAVPGNCDVDPETRSLTGFSAMAGDGITIAPAWAAPGIELIGLAGEPGSRALAGERAADISGGNGLHVVASHYPVLDLEPDLAEAGFRHSGNLTNRAEIEADLRASGAPVMVLHGHLHVHAARISGSLLQLSCAALIEPPHQVSVVEIEIVGETVTVDWRSHSVWGYAVDRLPVFTGESGRWVWSSGSWLAHAE